MAKDIKPLFQVHQEHNFFEKRKSFRVNTHIEVMLLQEPSNKNCFIKNISGGGAFIEIDDDIPFGTVLNLQLHLSEQDHSIQLKTVVVWRNLKPAKH